MDGHLEVESDSQSVDLALGLADQSPECLQLVEHYLFQSQFIGSGTLRKTYLVKLC